MASRTPQLRQSFLVTGAGVALVLVIAFATLSGNSAQRTAERQAQDLGQDAATRVATLVDQYLRERRHEAEALAASPAVVRAAIDAAQQATQEKLPRLDIPTLERMFAQRRALGGARAVGVLRTVFALDRLSRLLVAAAVSGGRLQVVDGTGRVMVSANQTELLHTLPDAAALPRTGLPARTTLRTGRVEEL